LAPSQGKINTSLDFSPGHPDTQQNHPLPVLGSWRCQRYKDGNHLIDPDRANSKDGGTANIRVKQERWKQLNFSHLTSELPDSVSFADSVHMTVTLDEIRCKFLGENAASEQRKDVWKRDVSGKSM